MSLAFLLAVLVSMIVAAAVPAWRRLAVVIGVVFMMGFVLVSDDPLGLRLFWVGLLAAGLAGGYAWRLRRS